MDYIKHPNHSRYIGKPLGWNESTDGPCGALSVQDKLDEPSRYPVMESAWMPTPEEALALATGYAQIRLGVFGRQHPVVYMGTAPMTPTDRQTYKASLLRAAQWLNALAEQGDLELVVTSGKVCINDKEAV